MKLATSTLSQMVLPEAPQNLIGDNAYDSDKLDAELRHCGIELVAPHRSNRKNKTQDERRLRDTVGAGRSRGYLPGCRTSGGWLSGTNDTLKTSLECFTLLAV